MGRTGRCGWHVTCHRFFRIHAPHLPWICQHPRVDSVVILPLGSLVLGSLLTFGLEMIRHRISRGEAVQDSRRLERSQAYVDFLDSAHEAAHLLGRATAGCPNPLIGQGDNYWRLDGDVSRKLRVIEVLGSAAVVAEAQALRRVLMDFREAVSDPTMVYGTPEYWEVYRPVMERRASLVAASRADLHSTR